MYPAFLPSECCSSLIAPDRRWEPRVLGSIRLPYLLTDQCPQLIKVDSWAEALQVVIPHTNIPKLSQQAFVGLDPVVRHYVPHSPATPPLGTQGAC